MKPTLLLLSLVAIALLSSAEAKLERVVERVEDEVEACEGAGEAFSMCGGHCEGSCNNPRPMCRRLCQSGCKCMNGYVRDERTNTCIPLEHCPARRLRDDASWSNSWLDEMDNEDDDEEVGGVWGKIGGVIGNDIWNRPVADGTCGPNRERCRRLRTRVEDLAQRSLFSSRQLSSCEGNQKNYLSFCLDSATHSYGCTATCKKHEKDPNHRFQGFHSCEELCSRKKGECYMKANGMCRRLRTRDRRVLSIASEMCQSKCGRESRSCVSMIPGVVRMPNDDYVRSQVRTCSKQMNSCLQRC